MKSSITFKRKKHYVHLGPLWWLDKIKNVNVFRGFNISYEFFPFKKNKLINFYFLYDFIFLYENNSWNTTMRFYPQKPITDEYEVDIQTKWRSFKNQLGYGFNLSIYKGLYLNQSFSIGLELYDYQSTSTVPEAMELSSSYSNSGSGTSNYLKIGLGYIFN